MRQIMRSSLDYVGFVQLCGRSPIMRAHNRIIPRYLVLTCLDYGRATLAGIASNQLDRLESVTNATAWLICSAQMSDHITQLLCDLHWLRVPQRIEFKLAALIFNCMHVMAPPYLAHKLCRVADMDCHRQLRSASTPELQVPLKRCITVSDRAIAVSTARVWNTLPSDGITSPSLIAFKPRLKTLLFSRSFDLRQSDSCS